MRPLALVAMLAVATPALAWDPLESDQERTLRWGREIDDMAVYRDRALEQIEAWEQERRSEALEMQLQELIERQRREDFNRTWGLDRR